MQDQLDAELVFTNLLELDPVPKTVEPKERRGVGYFPFL